MLPAVVAVATVAVVPYVPTRDTAWCPEVSYGPAAAPALLAAAAGPLLNDGRWVSDRVAWLSLLLMVVYCSRAACYGVATVLGGVLAAVLLHHISQPPQKVRQA